MFTNLIARQPKNIRTILEKKKSPLVMVRILMEVLQEEMAMRIISVAATNTNRTTLRSSRVARWEVNFDELPYDPDRRRISDYIG